MTVYNWVGTAGDNNWQTNTNWSPAPASKPGDGDTCIFSAGAIPVTAGLSNANTTMTIIGTDGYTGYIGSASAPLVQTSFTLIQWAGRGPYAKFSGTITTLQANISSASSLYISGGTTTNAYVNGTGGTLTKESAATITNIRIAKGAKYDAQGTNAHTLIDNAGTVTSTSNVGTYKGRGGDNLTVRGTATATALELSSTSVCNYQSSGTITAMEGPAGAKFSVAQSETTTGTLTITTLYRHPGFDFARKPPGVSITVTTENVIGFDN